MNRKGVDWSSPETIVLIVLSILLISAFFYFVVWKKIGVILH